MIENSTQGLTVLGADLDVEVVDTDADALSAWAPAPGRHARRVAAELAAVGDARGRQWIEVRIDGVTVGGLPADAAQRHSRHIDAVLDRGGRPAANALVLAGPRLELRLPDPASPVRAPLPPAGPAADRPDALGRFEPLPDERPRSRTPLLVGAGVLALLLVVGVAVGVRPGAEPAATGPAAIRITTPAPVPTTAPVTTAPAAPAPVEADADADRDSGTDARAQAEPVATPTRARRPVASRAPAAEAPAPTTGATTVAPTTTPAPAAALLPSPSPDRAPRPDRDRADDCEEPAVGPPDPDCAEAPADPQG